MFSFLNNSNNPQQPELTQAGTVPCAPIDSSQRIRNCYVCGWTPPSNPDLPRHFNEMHADDAKSLREQLALDLYPLPNNTTPEQVFDCRICHEGFDRLYSLLRHQRSNHAALAVELELELSEGLFNSQFPRQPISEHAFSRFAHPQSIPRFSQPPCGRAAGSVNVVEDVAMTPTVDVSFAELQLVTPQPSRVSNRELANSHLRDYDADRLFLDTRYVAPQAHAKLTLPSSVALPVAINNDDAEDLALTPDMDVSFEDLRAVTPQRTGPSTNKPASLKLVTKSIEVAETRDVHMTNKLPRVIVRFSAPSPVDHRATPARKIGKAPAAKNTPSNRQAPYQSYSDKCAANIAAANKQTAAEKEQRSPRNAINTAPSSPQRPSTSSTAPTTKTQKPTPTPSTKPKLFKCDALHCDRAFVNINQLCNHIQRLHSQDSDELVLLARDKKPWACLVSCGVRFQTRKLRTEHFYRGHGDICDEDKAVVIENWYEDGE
ncbi:hypothetical protein D6C91_09104 [Aureobasidium pullulans]|uniref:C2H2-type domain-containing protein n=1 Tax=Aureobasidium pullulans TaxID=5580 RepID=A0A4S9SKK5_AURPU|nr:hypothetical protein D6C91_09104 [Aureobasidium pullulans]